MTALVHRLSARGPDDTAPLDAAIAAGAIDPKGIVAILGKTEGNGCVNDFTRAFAVRELRDVLSRYLSADNVARVSLVMSGGTEGGLAPHWLVLERRRTEGGTGPALAIGSAHTPELAPEHLGRRAQAQFVAAGVRAAMTDAGIDSPDDVHFVQIKCPLLTAGRIAQAEARGVDTATRDTLKSMGLSRGASALGVALALDELDAAQITDAAIGRDFTLWSGRASTSAGVELMNHEIVVLGMSRHWSGPLAVDHAVMADGIDIEPVRAALARAGFTARARCRKPNGRGWWRCWPRRKPAPPAACVAIATPCSTIPTSPRPAMPAPSSPVRSPASSATAKSSFPAARSIKVPTAAVPSPSSRHARRHVHDRDRTHMALPP